MSGDAPFPAVIEGRIGDAFVQTVNARDLHSFLEVGKDFTTWIKDRIAAYAFNECSDFVVIEAAPQNRGAGNRGARTEYALTIDMAKCQSASKFDPLSAFNIDPLAAISGGSGRPAKRVRVAQPGGCGGVTLRPRRGS